MLPGQSTLEIYRIWRFDRSVGTQFNRRSLHKGPCCHDDIAVVSRHCPRFRIYITVDRCRCLNTLTERNHFFRCSERYRLNDIVAALRTVRNHGKSKTLIDICRKDCTFQCGSSDRRCKDWLTPSVAPTSFPSPGEVRRYAALSTYSFLPAI